MKQSVVSSEDARRRKPGRLNGSLLQYLIQFASLLSKTKPNYGTLRMYIVMNVVYRPWDLAFGPRF